MNKLNEEIIDSNQSKILLKSNESSVKTSTTNDKGRVRSVGNLLMVLHKDGRKPFFDRMILNGDIMVYACVSKDCNVAVYDYFKSLTPDNNNLTTFNSVFSKVESIQSKMRLDQGVAKYCLEGDTSKEEEGEFELNRIDFKIPNCDSISQSRFYFLKPYLLQILREYVYNQNGLSACRSVFRIIEKQMQYRENIGDLFTNEEYEEIVEISVQDILGCWSSEIVYKDAIGVCVLVLIIKNRLINVNKELINWLKQISKQKLNEYYNSENIYNDSGVFLLFQTLIEEKLIDMSLNELDDLKVVLMKLYDKDGVPSFIQFLLREKLIIISNNDFLELINSLNLANWENGDAEDQLEFLTLISYILNNEMVNITAVTGNAIIGFMCESTINDMDGGYGHLNNSKSAVVDICISIIVHLKAIFKEGDLDFDIIERLKESAMNLIDNYEPEYTNLEIDMLFKLEANRLIQLNDKEKTFCLDWRLRHRLDIATVLKNPTLPQDSEKEYS